MQRKIRRKQTIFTKMRSLFRLILILQSKQREEEIRSEREGRRTRGEEEKAAGSKLRQMKKILVSRGKKQIVPQARLSRDRSRSSRPKKKRNHNRRSRRKHKLPTSPKSSLMRPTTKTNTPSSYGAPTAHNPFVI